MTSLTPPISVFAFTNSAYNGFWDQVGTLIKAETRQRLPPPPCHYNPCWTNKVCPHTMSTQALSVFVKMFSLCSKLAK